MKSKTVESGAGHAERSTTDHGFLLQMLRWLESAGDGVALAQLLDDLHDFLKHHFEAEEQPRGFFDRVVRASPWHSAHVAALRAEHPQMLEEVARLRGEVTRDLHPVSQATRDAVVELVRSLRRHEALEEQLLVDAHTTDLGGGQ